MSYYKLNDFPKLKILLDGWEIIRSEALNVPKHYINVNRVNKEHKEVSEEILSKIKLTKKNGWVLGWNNRGLPNKKWTQYGIMLDDEETPYSETPKTIELLKKIGGIKVAALNALEGESILGTHTHPEIETENLAQMHICLDAEDRQSYLCVDGEFFEYKTGNYVIFNGSRPHFAINAGKQERLILYMEFKK